MMDEHHDKAMELADEADATTRAGRGELGREQFRDAAVLEEEAVAHVLEDQPRARGILSVSAVSLWMSAGELERAADLARRYRDSVTPGFARQLDELLGQIELRKRREARLPRVSDDHAEAVLAALRTVEEQLVAGRIVVSLVESAA